MTLLYSLSSLVAVQEGVLSDHRCVSGFEIIILADVYVGTRLHDIHIHIMVGNAMVRCCNTLSIVIPRYWQS